MRLLLDTHTLIWHYENKTALGKKALAALNDESNERFISIASIWEMNIKIGTGKLRLGAPAPEIVSWYKNAGATILDIEEVHAHGVRTLPSIHRDPFDRMLVSQAKHEGLILVTVDERIRQYPVEWLW